MKKVRMLALVCAAAMLSGCTTYYEVTDPTTDKTYYTTELERNRDGSVELKDTNSGKMVTLQNSEVAKIDKDAYKAKTQQ